MTEKSNLETPTKEESSLSSIKLFLRDVVFIVLAVLLLQSVAYATYHIPSGSMEPTLEIGDRVSTFSAAYGLSRYNFPFNLPLLPGKLFEELPKRGDIVVFKKPRNPDERLIKRAIGLPGDRIAMRNGRLFINGEMVKRVLRGHVRYRNRKGRSIKAAVYDEYLPGGVVHQIFEISDHENYDNMGEVVVPPGHIFFMGDNRDNSGDSRNPRDLGPVPSIYLIGRAEILLFSLYDCEDGKRDNCEFGFAPSRTFRSLKEDAAPIMEPPRAN